MSTWALTVDGIQNGDWWRLWTAHLTHYSWRHALLDLCAAAPAILMMPTWLRRIIPLWLMIVSPLLSVSLLSVPGLLEYRGCSGLVVGLWTLVGVVLIRTGPNEYRPWAALLLIAVTIKSLCEAAGIVPVWQEDRWQSLPLAHWLGAVLGVLSGLSLSGLAHRQMNSEKSSVC